MFNYEDYENYLIEKERMTVRSSLLNRKRKQFRDENAFKQYKESTLFKEDEELSLNRHKDYLYIVSDEGRAQNKQFYNEHKSAIDLLLSKRSSITEFAVKKEEFNILGKIVDLSFIENGFDTYYNKAKDRLIKFFKEQIIEYAVVDDDNDVGYYYNKNYVSYKYINLLPNNFIRFVELYESAAFEHNTFKGSSYTYSYFNKHFIEQSNKVVPAECKKNKKLFYSFIEPINKRMKEYDFARKMVDKLSKEFTIEYILKLLSENTNYQPEIIEEFKDKYKSYVNLKEDILSTIPDNYVDLYPKARKLNRHFILHIGPTNSGKTYEAIECLKKAKSGAYLAPLRLLAYEQFDKMNKDGVHCNLLTGEEQIEVPFSNHVASTIEMVDLSKFYECVVIDEAQLIDDCGRGAAWTKAILGILSNEIHICAAPYAKDILIRLIEECDDTYEIINTKRQTELRTDNKNFKFPESVKDNDALIVFSRKDVHSIASVLQSRGIKCSMIYGNLPYDVRHNEAEKFNTGKTSVVVSTDAIGMGLNLPIKRIVFMSNEKFDGTEVRTLTATEVQQIAGRAGRFGIFDKGLFNSVENKGYISNCVHKTIEPITEARISFATSLIDLNVNLSVILKKWNELPVKEGYLKSDISKEIRLCRLLEDLTEDKHLIYNLITIPFSDREDYYEDIWFSLAKKVIHNEVPDVTKNRINYNNKSNLIELETAYKVADLYYYFYNKFWNNKESIDYLMNIKSEISKLSIAKLNKNSAEAKRCNRCGKILEWNYPYTICQECYYGNRRHYDYDFYY